MASLKRTLTQTGVYVFGIGASKGVAVLLVPLYTRQLLPASVAVWDLCTTTVLFALAFVEVGMASAVARFYIQADTEDARRRFAQTSMAVVLIASVLALALTWLFARPFSRVLLGDETLTHLILLVGVTTVFTAISNQPLALLRAQERAVAFSWLCLVRAVIAPLLIVFLVVVLRMGVTGILLGDAAGLGFMALAGVLLNRKASIPRIDSPSFRTLMQFGVPLVPIGLATAIILLSDRYFLRQAVGLDRMAVYTLGFKVAMVMSLVAQALQTAWAPSAFRIAKEPDAQAQLARAFRVLFSALCLMALAMSAASPELVRLFGPAKIYGEAYRVVPWIAFSYAFQSAVLIVTANLVIPNKTVYATLVFCSGAVLKLALNFVMIPRWGIEGAAASTLAAYVLELALAFAFSRLIYSVPYRHFRVLAFTGCIAVAAFLAASTTPLALGLSVPLRLAVLAAAVASAFVTGLLTQREMRAMWASIACFGRWNRPRTA